jgi:hypothetical protein
MANGSRALCRREEHPGRRQNANEPIDARVRVPDDASAQSRDERGACPQPHEQRPLGQ